MATSRPNPPVLRIMYTLPMRFVEFGNVTNKNRAHRSAPVYGAKLRWALSVSCLLNTERVRPHLTHDLGSAGDLSNLQRYRVRRAARGLKSDSGTNINCNRRLSCARVYAHVHAYARDISCLYLV